MQNQSPLEPTKVEKSSAHQAPAFSITPFQAADLQQVQELILSIENEELNLNLTLNDQPDMKDIAANYQQGRSNFWVASAHKGGIIGCVGLYDLGNNQADLRKMFVHKHYRGKTLGVANSLYRTLLKHAKTQHFQSIYLESSYKFHAALAFYRQKGFNEISKSALPQGFPIIKTAECFFKLSL